MENTQHDSHQFFFERYLRNKLSDQEKLQLEESLKDDAELNAAFLQYKLHRKEFLTELKNDYYKGPRKSRLANVLYVVISIIGIITALNFYFENKSLKEERQRDKNLITRLIEHIPFVGRKSHSGDRNQKKQDSSTKDKNTLTKYTNQPPITDSTEVEQEAQLILDTVLVTLHRSFYTEKHTYFKSNIDSTLTNAEIQQIVLKNFGKYDIKYKSKPIGIVIWSDLQKGNTYIFDGFKLTLYGIPRSTQMLIVDDESELVWLWGDKEILLLADNQPHTY
jgi:hypothetical protein